MRAQPKRKSSKPLALAWALPLLLCVESSRLIASPCLPSTPFLELQQELPVAAMGVGVDVALSSAGDLYISDPSQGVLRKDAQQGWQNLRSSTAGESLPRHPSSIEVDAEGWLWIADPDRHRVVVLKGDDELVSFDQRTGWSLRRPSRLSRSLTSEISVWDAAEQRLIRLRRDSSTVQAPSPSVAQGQPLAEYAPAEFSLAAKANTAYCIDAQRHQLTRWEANRLAATWPAPGEYPRLTDLAMDESGSLIVTDTANRRVYWLSADLQRAIPLDLYAGLLRSPTRLALAGDQLWLVDEGRKSLLGFRLRTAQTSFEHALLGEELLAVNQPQRALVELQQARSCGLSRPDLEVSIGQAFYTLGRFSDALATWDALPDGMRDQPRVTLRRANAYYRLRDYREAAGLYRAIQPDAAESSAARFNLAQAQLALGDGAEATKLLGQLLSEQPDNPRYALTYAEALAVSGDLAEALARFEDLSSQPEIAGEASYWLGHLRLAQGNAAAAVEPLERAASQGPRYRAALDDLIDAYQRLNDPQRAAQMRQRRQGVDANDEAYRRFILEERS